MEMVNRYKRWAKRNIMCASSSVCWWWVAACMSSLSVACQPFKCLDEPLQDPGAGTEFLELVEADPIADPLYTMEHKQLAIIFLDK